MGVFTIRRLDRIRILLECYFSDMECFAVAVHVNSGGPAHWQLPYPDASDIFIFFRTLADCLLEMLSACAAA